MDANQKGKNHNDLARWKERGLEVQLFSVFCKGNKINPFTFANQLMDSLDAVLNRNTEKFLRQRTASYCLTQNFQLSFERKTKVQ